MTSHRHEEYETNEKYGLLIGIQVHEDFSLLVHAEDKVVLVLYSFHTAGWVRDRNRNHG